MGEPVSTAFAGGNWLNVSGKLQQTFFATGMQSLLASPGVMSDSWMIQGIPKDAAARTTGTLTKPPLEKSTSGLISFRYFLASRIPLMTRNGSEKFFGSKYLLNFPVAMP